MTSNKVIKDFEFLLTHWERCDDCGGESYLYDIEKIEEDDDTTVVYFDFYCPICDEDYELIWTIPTELWRPELDELFPKVLAEATAKRPLVE